MHSLYIAVIGDGDCDAETATLAEAVGREVARAGAVLVCGGLGGVMEAACRGAKAAGGTTLGILPGPDRRAANRYVDCAVVTNMGEARNAIVVNSADAVVAVGGRWGTLSEIALARRRGAPVIGLRSWQLVHASDPDLGLEPAETPEEAVARAVAQVQGRRPPPPGPLP